MIIIDKFMQDSRNIYFQNLISKTSPRSMSISHMILSQKLEIVQLEDIIKANPQINERNHDMDLSLQRNSRHKYKHQLNEGKMMTEESPRSFFVIEETCPSSKTKKENELKTLKQARNNYSIRLKTAPNTLEKLKLQKYIIATIRKEQQVKRQLDQYIEQKRKQQAAQLEEQQEILNKRIMIAQKLNRISMERQKRTELLSAKSSPTLPRYKVMEKKFMMNQIKEQIQRSLYLKKLKQLKLQQYAKSIDKDLKRHKNESNERKKQQKSEISMEASPSKRQLHFQNKAKMQLLQERRKQMKIKINHQKQHELEIMKDKTLNPYKYTYLRMKQLTDEQIYTEFKDFQMNINSSTLGNDYLRQSKQRIKTSTANNPKKDEQIIRDKLHINEPTGNKQFSSKLKKGQNMHKVNRIDEILKQSDCKSKLIELLHQESIKTKNNMNGLKSQLQKPRHYEELLKLQADIDIDYLNLLKTKIVSLQLHAKE